MNKIFLSDLIKDERKKLHKLSFIEIVKNKRYLLYIPNIKIIFGIIIFIAVIIGLSFLFPKFVIPKESNTYQNIISVHTGIGIFIFSLFIFIAENFRDREGRDRGKVLLKVSNIFPIAIIEILIFFIFFLFNINIWIIILICLNGILVIYSLWRIIHISLSQSYFIEERNSLFSDKILQSINLALNERIGNFILLRKLENNEIRLKYSYFSDFKEEQYYYFNLERTGIITDINLDKLRKFSELIDNSAVQNGYVYLDSDKKDIFNYSIRNNEIQRSENLKIEINSNRYLLKRFNTNIGKGDNKIFRIEKKLIKGNEKLLNNLRKLTEEIFVVKNINNLNKDFRQELFDKKDEFISAIKNSELGKIEELCDFYLGLMEAFLKFLRQHKLEYSFKSAITERTSLFSEWKEITWLFKDLYDIFEKGLISKDRNIILQFSALPFRIAIISIDNNDHYLFQKFLYFYKYLYFHAKQTKDDSLRELMIDKSWVNLEELSNFYIEANLLKSDSDNSKINSLKDYAVFIFIILQELLKDSYENKDFSSFKKFNKVAVKIFKNFEPSNSINNSEYYKFQLDSQNLENLQKKQLEKLLEKQKFLESMEKEINLRKNQMFLGLNSYLLSQLKENDFNNTIKNFFEIIDNNLDFNLEDLANLFLETNKFDTEQFWGWDSWELKDIDEAQWIDFKGKIEQYYCLKVLKILAYIKDNEFINFKLPLDRNFIYLSGKNDRFHLILDDIVKNKEKWAKILSEKEFQRIETFKDILLNTIKRQENQDRERKRITEISKIKIKEFINEFISGFNEEVVLREFFKKNNLYSDKKDIIKKNNLFGINTIVDKAIFFDNWHISYPEWGSKYGKDLAFGEDSTIIELLAKKSKKIKESDFNKSFSSFQRISDIVIFTTHNSLYDFFENTKSFKPDWYLNSPKSDLKGFRGWYYLKEDKDKVPVLISSSRKIKKLVMILDKNSLGKLIQYNPVFDNSYDFLKDIFYINIQSFSENIKLLEEFINKPPEWLNKIGNKIEQENYLKEHALIKIFESFEFKISDNFHGYIIDYAD